MEVTPIEIRQRIEAYTGLNLASAFEDKNVTLALKRHTRYARQNGIHVSPTIMLNGLIDERFESGNTIEKWADCCR